MLRQLILPLLFLMGLSGSIRADELRFDNFGVKDGLSQVTIYTIYQDETGALWFGSREGLNRYNGHQFSCFTATEEGEGLTENEIMALCGDREGSIYVQVMHDLLRYDVAGQTFHRLSV